MSKLSVKRGKDILVGFEERDDAAVARMENEFLVFTVDFITPVMDDPEIFGEIAAANSLSDVYAMGAEPWLCLNIICFPACKLDISWMERIVSGGLRKIEEAGAFLVGGHSVDDVELKFGLCVVGRAKSIIRNSGAKPGDLLFLTKPLGSGIIVTAIKADMAEDSVIQKVADIMRTLNKEASSLMVSIGAHAATDITGFGLLGHALEMAKASKVNLVIKSENVPVIEEALDYAGYGLIPAGAYENREAFSAYVEAKRALSELEMIFYDPQTSGGLLVAVPEDRACDFPYPCIGYVTEGEGRIILE